jgi:futalosine hydrolase
MAALPAVPDRHPALYDRPMPAVLIVAATRGELCGHDGLECGVGPVEAAAATARALAADPRVRAVLHVGLAGALGVPVGSLVVGAASLYDDIAARWPVVDDAVPDPALLAAALVAVPEAVAVPIHTSAAVARPRDSTHGEPIVEAMEGFGVLRAAAQAGVAAVEVRAISNELGEEDRARWDVDGALARLGTALPALLAALGGATAGSG